MCGITITQHMQINVFLYANNFNWVSFPCPLTSHKAISKPSNDVPLISPIVFRDFFLKCYSVSEFDAALFSGFKNCKFLLMPLYLLLLMGESLKMILNFSSVNASQSFFVNEMISDRG